MKTYVVFFSIGYEVVKADSMQAALDSIDRAKEFEHLTQVYECIGETVESVVRGYNEKCR